MIRTSLDFVDAVVEGGACVISAERSSILKIVQETVNSGRSATFYVTLPQFDAINEWYWTAERRSYLKVEQVSDDEKLRIESELGIRNAGFHFSNRITCGNCGSVYGAYEFVQQGMKEHGRETVEAAFALSNAAIVRVNPSTVAVCQSCAQILRIVGGTIVPHYYSMDRYGCCMGGTPALQ